MSNAIKDEAATNHRKEEANSAECSSSSPLSGGEVKMPRVEILDPLRGLAALAVAWFHFTNGSGAVKTEWLKASGEYGWLGVEVFFVISGFVVPFSLFSGGYRLSQHFGRFLGKRMIRLEPPYLASIALVIALWYLTALSPMFAGTAPQFTTVQLLLHVGYLNTFFDYGWLSPVYWTLGIEFQFYLFAALVYPLLTARLPLVRMTVMAVIAGTPLLVRTPMLVFSYLDMFALGTLAFQYRTALLPRWAFLAAVSAVSAVVFAVHGWPVGVAAGATALVIGLLPVLRHPAMGMLVYLGSISYSLYLLHTTVGGRVINLGARFGSGMVWELCLVGAALGVSVAAAAGFHWIVERPSQRLSSKLKYSAPRECDKA